MRFMERLRALFAGRTKVIVTCPRDPADTYPALHCYIDANGSRHPIPPTAREQLSLAADQIMLTPAFPAIRPVDFTGFQQHVTMLGLPYSIAAMREIFELVSIDLIPEEGDLDRPLNYDPDASIAATRPSQQDESTPALTLDELLGDEVAALIRANKLPRDRQRSTATD